MADTQDPQIVRPNRQTPQASSTPSNGSAPQVKFEQPPIPPKGKGAVLPERDGNEKIAVAPNGNAPATSSKSASSQAPANGTIANGNAIDPVSAAHFSLPSTQRRLAQETKERNQVIHLQGLIAEQDTAIQHCQASLDKLKIGQFEIRNTILEILQTSQDRALLAERWYMDEKDMTSDALLTDMSGMARVKYERHEKSKAKKAAAKVEEEPEVKSGQVKTEE